MLNRGDPREVIVARLADSISSIIELVNMRMSLATPGGAADVWVHVYYMVVPALVARRLGLQH